MTKTLAFIVLMSGIGAPAALAAEDELASVEDLSYVPEVFLVSDQRKKDCARVPGVCLYADGGGTVAGVDVDPTVGVVTTLARGTQVAGLAKSQAPGEIKTWHAELVARFRTRTNDAPLVVAVLDYADPEGIARKEATSVWQLSSPGTKDLGVRLVLSSDDGFLPHHTYLIRVVQSVAGTEKILAEGNVLLE